MDIKSSITEKTGDNLGYLIAIIVAAIVLAVLQHQYWHGEYGHANTEALREKVSKQERLNEEQAYENSILVADIQDLKSGLAAIEEHARLDLGLIKPGEVFIQLSNAPVTYSRQTPKAIDNTIESVDSVPEISPSTSEKNTKPSQ